MYFVNYDIDILRIFGYIFFFLVGFGNRKYIFFGIRFYIIFGLDEGFEHKTVSYLTTELYYSFLK